MFQVFFPVGYRKKTWKIEKRRPVRAGYGRGTNYCTIWLKITPKLRQNCTQKTRHPRRPKLAAARSAAANFVRRLCRVFCVQFWRNFQPNRAIICPSTVTLAGCIEIGWFLDRSAPFFTQIPNLASKSMFRKNVIFSRANAPARLLRSKTLVNAYFQGFSLIKL